MCVAYPVMEGPKGQANPVLHYASIPLASADGDEQHDMHRYTVCGLINVHTHHAFGQLLNKWYITTSIGIHGFQCSSYSDVPLSPI